MLMARVRDWHLVDDIKWRRFADDVDLKKPEQSSSELFDACTLSNIC